MHAAPDSVEQALVNPGSPLEPALRGDMEERFGHDFSKVRVHTDAAAKQSALDVNAHAYTVGHDMVFGAGRFTPGTQEGRRLIAHELTHAVQQSGGSGTYASQDNEKRDLSPIRLLHWHGEHNASSRAVQRQPTDDDLERYRIEGGRYSPKEKQHAAEHLAGLVLTSPVIGKEEQKLSMRGPTPIFVSKEKMRFDGGRLGEFVSDFNEFTHYFDDVLHGIGRLRDLLSAGAPEAPTDMTATQKRALRPTDDTQPSLGKKDAYRNWLEAQAKYATMHAKGGLPGGLVFEVARTGRDFDKARQEFWEAKGKLSRTIAAAKGLTHPQFDLQLKLSDLVSLADPVTAVATGLDKLIEARQKRQEYDAKMKEFEAAVTSAGDAARDDFEAFKRASATYWTKVADHQAALEDRDNARIESRQRAAHVGQAIAEPAETRSPVLAGVRMPLLVADAWHALAVTGPPARQKLAKVLLGETVVVTASKKDWGWRDDPMELNDITQIRLAWQQAQSWEVVLTKEEVEEWVAMDKLWEETLTKFNV